MIPIRCLFVGFLFVLSWKFKILGHIFLSFLGSSLPLESSFPYQSLSFDHDMISQPRVLHSVSMVTLHLINCSSKGRFIFTPIHFHITSVCQQFQSLLIGTLFQELFSSQKQNRTNQSGLSCSLLTTAITKRCMFPIKISTWITIWEYSLNAKGLHSGSYPSDIRNTL